LSILALFTEQALIDKIIITNKAIGKKGNIFFIFYFYVWCFLFVVWCFLFVVWGLLFVVWC
jgi:hypothetical protein